MTPRILFDLLESWRNGDGLGKDRRIQNWAEEVRWFEGYADGSEAPHGVVSANWNDLDTYDRETQKRVHVSDVPSRMCALFERMGVAIEWSDQVTACNTCYRCIQTEPDSYSWTPQYILGDGEITCAECAKDEAESLLKSFEHKEAKAWTLDAIDPLQHGYVNASDRESPYESGWHPGQTDDPRKIAADLRARGISRFLFIIDETSQFYTRWSVLVHESEADLLDGPNASEDTDATE